MNKIYYTSPMEKMVLETAPVKGPILFEDVSQALDNVSVQVIRNVFSNLVSKGILYRLQQGIYLRCGEPFLPVIDDPAKLALTIYPGYLAFFSALHHWGLHEYEPFIVTVATRNRSAERGIGEYTIRAVAMGERAQGMVYDEGVYVSTLEKTIFDCIYKPNWSGGYNLVVRAIADSEPDWKEVLFWLDELGSQSLRQRAGYILSKAGNAPEWLLTLLKEDKLENIWLDPSAVRRGNRVREWGIIDNAKVRDAYG